MPAITGIRSQNPASAQRPDPACSAILIGGGHMAEIRAGFVVMCLALAAGCGDNLGPLHDAAPGEPDAGPDAGPDPGVTVTPTSGLVTTEAGGEDTFTVVLDSQPTAEVEIELA